MVRKYNHYYKDVLVKTSSKKWDSANISETDEGFEVISFHKDYLNACFKYRELKRKNIKGLKTVHLDIREA